MKESRTAYDRPQAYELGEWEFYGLTLKVTPDVLIPRPDTERLVDLALAFLKNRPGEQYILDLCCGSGCVGLAVAAHCPAARVTYGDISEAALAVARSNGCEDIRVIDALKPPSPGLGPFDALLCNPPYVTDGDTENLDASVRDYEPPVALFGGRDGLDFYRALLPDWLSVLRPGGLFAVEIGFDQAAAVERMTRDAGLDGVAVRRDYGGRDRIVSGYIK
jgi:release factor glutamine methyltransferase